MKHLQIILFIAALSSIAHSGTADFAWVRCKILGFDSKMVKMNCDPEASEKIVNTPRDWLAKEKTLQAGKIVEFKVTRDQINQWPTFNNRDLPRKPSAKESK